MACEGPFLVTGGTGYVGPFLLRRLLDSQARPVRVLARPASDRSRLPAGVEVVTGDLGDPASLSAAARGARVVLHLAHAGCTGALLAALDRSAQRLVVVSSLRVLSRVPSASVARVAAGEAAAAAGAVPWTVLRASMVFGPGDDRNISRLARRLRQWRWVPAIGAGCLHQPVFVEDLVQAVLSCLHHPATVGRGYAIAGPSPLTYRDLVAAVGAAVGVPGRLVPLPAGPAAAILSAFEGLGLQLPIAAEQVRRMLEDKVYDIEPARRDLGYAPLSFPAALARIYGSGSGGSRG